MQQVSDALKAELVSKLVNNDLSVYEVAAQYHINPPTIYLWLREQGQLYQEAKLLTPDFLNLSGKAYYVVEQLGTATQAVSAAPAPTVVPEAAQSEARAAPLPASVPETVDIESSEPQVAPASDSQSANAPVPASAEPASVSAEPAAQTEATAQTEAAATTPAPTMAFPTPETQISKLEDLSAKLGVTALTADERVAEEQAQAAVCAAQEQTAEVKVHTTQDLAQAIVPQPSRGTPLPEEDEAEVVDDCSTDNWGDVGNLDNMELELPASDESAPEAQVEEDEAEDDELTAEEKDEILSRIERKEVTVNVISDAYDIPQFIIYQWLKERELQRAQAQAEEVAQERAAQEAEAAAEAAARKEARAIAAGERVATRKRDGRGMKVSGDRKMSNSMLAESFNVSVSFVSVLLREVREEGLLPWCLSLRNLDSEYPGAADLMAREHKEKQPEVAFAQISAFKLAAVDAVLNHGLSVNKSAAIFGIAVPTLHNWVNKTKAQGLEAWAQGAGISEEDFAWLTPRD